MEGADPIVQVQELPRWWERGLRMIGLTFGDTQYGTGVAGGSTTFKHGGLTAEGFALLESMAELGFIWDISHLTEEGIWQGLDLKFPRVCASHANVQALTPTDRHLSDKVIRAVAERAQDEFSRLDLAFPTLWGRTLQLIDCQNLFCEVDKYARVVHPTVQGLSCRTRIKQKFVAKSAPLPQWYPPKWGLSVPEFTPSGTVDAQVSLNRGWQPQRPIFHPGELPL
jgi:hypothetical protein